MKLTKNKNFVTLASVLSVFLAFILVTALCLFACDRLGIMRVELFPPKDKESVGEAGGKFSLPIHVEAPFSGEEIPSGKRFYEKLLRNAPFTEDYYLRLRILSDTLLDNTAPPSGEYEIWHFGERYKIHWYGNDGRVKKVITCDGTRVQIIDYQAASNEYYDVSSGYTYEEMTPLPRFGVILPLVREVFEYSEKDGICMAACEYPTISQLDTVRFSMTTGVLRSFSRYRDGRTAFTIDVVTSDLDFTFSDYMFEIK